MMLRDQIIKGARYLALIGAFMFGIILSNLIETTRETPFPGNGNWCLEISHHSIPIFILTFIFIAVGSYCGGAYHSEKEQEEDDEEW